jgi:hypothetical protein
MQNATRSNPWSDTASGQPGHAMPTRDAAALIEWRAAALRALFPLTFSLIAQPMDRWRAIAVHRYLCAATTFEDLHRRIEEVRVQGTLARPDSLTA